MYSFQTPRAVKQKVADIFNLFLHQDKRLDPVLRAPRDADPSGSSPPHPPAVVNSTRIEEVTWIHDEQQPEAEFTHSRTVELSAPNYSASTFEESKVSKVSLVCWHDIANMSAISHSSQEHLRLHLNGSYHPTKRLNSTHRNEMDRPVVVKRINDSTSSLMSSATAESSYYKDEEPLSLDMLRTPSPVAPQSRAPWQGFIQADMRSPEPSSPRLKSPFTHFSMRGDLKHGELWGDVKCAELFGDICDQQVPTCVDIPRSPPAKPGTPQVTATPRTPATPITHIRMYHTPRRVADTPDKFHQAWLGTPGRQYLHTPNKTNHSPAEDRPRLTPAQRLFSPYNPRRAQFKRRSTARVAMVPKPRQHTPYKVAPRALHLLDSPHTPADSPSRLIDSPHTAKFHNAWLATPDRPSPLTPEPSSPATDMAESTHDTPWVSYDFSTWAPSAQMHQLCRQISLQELMAASPKATSPEMDPDSILCFSSEMESTTVAASERSKLPTPCRVHNLTCHHDSSTDVTQSDASDFLSAPLCRLPVTGTAKKRHSLAHRLKTVGRNIKKQKMCGIPIRTLAYL